MKPLHIGLLVIGAALAGGLAVKMAEPPSSLSSSPATRPAPKAFVPPPQPKPVADTATAIAGTPAPPPVYAEPEETAPVIARVKLPDAPEEKPKRPERWRTASKAAAPVTAPEKSRAPQVVAKASPPPSLPAPIAYTNPAPSATPIPTPPTDTTPAPESAKAPEPASSEPAREVPPPVRQVILQPGTTIPVRLLQTISSERAVNGDTFQATLAEPLVVDGLVVAERGARVSGRILNARAAGHFSGVSLLELSLYSFETADGQRINISTEPWAKQDDPNRTRNDAAKIGGGAALGAIIGAIAGGGKGAAIGAGVGGGAGVGAVAATSPKPLQLATESLLRFRLSSRVTITERPL